MGTKSLIIVGLLLLQPYIGFEAKTLQYTEGVDSQLELGLKTYQGQFYYNLFVGLNSRVEKYYQRNNPQPIVGFRTEYYL